MIQAVEAAQWSQMVPRISSSNLEAVFGSSSCKEACSFVSRMVEKAMALILDKHDPDRVPDNETVNDFMKKGGAALANALTVLSKGLNDDLSKKCQNIITLCLGVPAPGQDTLDEAVHALATESTSEIYRVFGASPAGLVLKDAAEQMNLALQAAKDATASLADCQTGFKMLSAMWGMYVAGEAVTMSDITSNIETTQTQFKKLVSALRAEGVGHDAKEEAIKSFYQFVDPIMASLQKQTFAFVEIPCQLL